MRQKPPEKLSTRSAAVSQAATPRQRRLYKKQKKPGEMKALEPQPSGLMNPRGPETGVLQRFWISTWQGPDLVQARTRSWRSGVQRCSTVLSVSGPAWFRCSCEVRHTAWGEFRTRALVIMGSVALHLWWETATGIQVGRSRTIINK